MGVNVILIEIYIWETYAVSDSIVTLVIRVILEKDVTLRNSAVLKTDM